MFVAPLRFAASRRQKMGDTLEGIGMSSFCRNRCDSFDHMGGDDFDFGLWKAEWECFILSSLSLNYI
jgi:hypothetical protein